MNENSATNQGKTSVCTAKNIMRVLSFLCMVFVFCPSFLVSCSSQEVNVNVMTAVVGVSSYGQTITKPHPIMLICLFIPIAILVLLFIKKLTDKKTAGIIAVCSAVDFVVWFIFRTAVKRTAEKNYCSFKTTGWFVINIISQLLIILFSVLIFIGKMKMEMDLIALFSGGGVQETLNQISDTVTNLADTVASNVNNLKQKENTIGFCAKCGKPIVYGCKFCTSCGTPVPESMIAEAEAARQAAEEAKRAEAAQMTETAGMSAEQTATVNKGSFCKSCGAKLQPGSGFCQECGTKVE